MTTAPGRTADLYPTRGAEEVLIERKDPVVWSAPGTPGPFTGEDLAGFERDGFRAVEQLLTPEEVGEYHAELERLVNDPAMRADERSIVEPRSQEVRSLFEVHRISEVFGRLAAHPREVARARP
ncbi:phytanoyl-CoA dioxygenase family protein, partial [Streptomyces lasiicapitis]|uniref:phytanoyl-CoA dioxygenase family protein n=1 Tax=Streptomyces lasiicapitis TaxID=1923961 RepID=UPI0036B4F601